MDLALESKRKHDMSDGTPVRGTPTRRRQTQSERSANSRALIIDAAIECLAKLGYSATTITLIAATAKMSMGRMQHQFATKAQIMAAVVETVYAENNALLAIDQLKARTPTERITEYSRVLKGVFERDSVLAALEIRLALRSDPELRETVAPLIHRYDGKSFLELERLLADAGVPERPAHIWMRMIVAVVRGLSLERALHYRSAAEPDTQMMLDMMIDLIVREGTKGTARK